MKKPEDWDKEGRNIVKNFEFGDFSQALGFVNRVGELANKADHHPDILIHGYKQVKIILCTHKVGRVTEKDYELANKINLVKEIAT